MLEMDICGYAYGRAGPTRRPTLVTREVVRERWRPAKVYARPGDSHSHGIENR
jgi:hypothetical protein